MKTNFLYNFSYSPFRGPGGGEVTVHAPATVANMVCGFDVLGFAVQQPYDEMHVRLLDAPGISIINEDAFNLPTEPEQNVAGVALLALLEETPEGNRGLN
jgi:homoserine kinase